MSDQSNIVSNHINQIVQQQNKAYYKLLLGCLERFGITKENANDFVGRMEYDVEYSYFMGLFLSFGIGIFWMGSIYSRLKKNKRFIRI